MIKAHRSKILIVDDKSENLYAMDSLLKDCLADIFLAQSGNEALSLTLHHHFALILLDVQMPEMSGYETANFIRQDEETRNTPIIFMTAMNTESQYVSQGYEVGAVDYLIKPINSHILLAKIQVFLALDRYQRELYALNQRYQLLLHCAGEGILGIDRAGHIDFSNSIAEQILGYPTHELLGRHLDKVLYSPHHAEIPAWEQSPIYMAYQAGQPYRVDDALFWRCDQQAIPTEYTSAPLRDEAGSFNGGVIIFQDITLRKQNELKLLALAQYDSLTGLANRSLFQAFLKSSIDRAKRRKGNMAVLLLDLDHFKSINDTYGHHAGDLLLQSVASRIHSSVVGGALVSDTDQSDVDLLKSVAQRLTHSLRRSDLVARLGGDEFAIVLDELAQTQDAAVVAQKILESMIAPHQLDHHEVLISPSIGIATYPACSEDAAELLMAADTALYQAKAQGRNNYQFYEPQIHRAAVERMRLEQDLRDALSRQQLFIHYQPLMDLPNGKVIGIEALLRWRHPELGMISPGRFIPVADRTGAIAELGSWVLVSACQQFLVWCEGGLLNDEAKLAVNISKRQLMGENFVESVRAALSACGLPATRLTIELTEDTLNESLGISTQVLHELRSLGVKIALDNFGCGYSSFNQIQSAPVDTLKLAQSFVERIGQDAKSDAVVKAIIDMAHTLNFSLIAEGVETAEQASFLQMHGCNSAQGFFISPCANDGQLFNLPTSRKCEQRKWC